MEILNCGSLIVIVECLRVQVLNEKFARIY